VTPENMTRAFEITHGELKPFETSDRRLGLSAVRAANRTVTALAIAGLLTTDLPSPDGDPDPALDEVERLATDLHKAQDALAFVGECCDVADQLGTPVTTALVRQWLKGAKCGRQLLAERAQKADRG
jgi:hypothetical protein